MRSFPANFQGPHKLAQQLHLDNIDPFCSRNNSQDSFGFHGTSEQNSKFWPPIIVLSTFKQSFKTILTFHKINETLSLLLLMTSPICLMVNSNIFRMKKFTSTSICPPALIDDAPISSLKLNSAVSKKNSIISLASTFYLV